MFKKNHIRPLAVAIGAAVAAGGTFAVQASDGPFGMTPLSSGYTVAEHGAGHEGKCGEGKCGEKKFEAKDTDKNGMVSMKEHMDHAEAKFKKVDTNGDGNVTKAEMEAAMKGGEGKCGEGKCGEGKGADGGDTEGPGVEAR